MRTCAWKWCFMLTSCACASYAIYIGCVHVVSEVFVVLDKFMMCMWVFVALCMFPEYISVVLLSF